MDKYIDQLKWVEQVFHGLFATSHQVKLVGGAEEPLYLPTTDEDHSARIIYTRDYVSSALHEIAHWCIAGESRRKLVDYGYWYEGDGRSLAAQKKFEAAEIKPQALEWIFSEAIGIRFRVSVDNLTGEPMDAETFKVQVVAQARHFLSSGMPTRATQFARALADAAGSAWDLSDTSRFSLQQLR